MAAANITPNQTQIPAPVLDSILVQLSCLNAIRALVCNKADYERLPDNKKIALSRILSIAEEAQALRLSLVNF